MAAAKESVLRVAVVDRIAHSLFHRLGPWESLNRNQLLVAILVFFFYLSINLVGTWLDVNSPLFMYISLGMIASGILLALLSILASFLKSVPWYERIIPVFATISAMAFVILVRMIALNFNQSGGTVTEADDGMLIDVTVVMIVTFVLLISALGIFMEKAHHQVKPGKLLFSVSGYAISIVLLFGLLEGLFLRR